MMNLISSYTVTLEETKAAMQHVNKKLMEYFDEPQVIMI